MSVVNNVLLDWKIILLGVGFLVMIVIINVIVPILPVSSFTFILSAVTVWFTTMCVTLIGLHKLLQRKESVNFNYFNTKQGLQKNVKSKSELKPNPKKLEKLMEDIDKFFITKWYCHISHDDNFILESKSFLNDIIRRFIEVQMQVNNKVLLHGCLNIYLKHIKEFRRSLKRKEKYDVGIEDLYRYSHICSTHTNKQMKNYFIQQLTIHLFRHFINSELWCSLPCHILVSILSRKLIAYILNHMSNPEFINYILLNALCSEGVKNNLELNKYNRVRITQYYDVKYSEVEKCDDKDNSDTLNYCNGNKNTESYGDDIKNVRDTETSTARQYNQDVSLKNDEVVLRHRKKPAEMIGNVQSVATPKKIDSVKIYEPKSSSKTWRDSRDLACVSLGHDPLDALQSPSESVKYASKVLSLENSRDNKEESTPNSTNNIFNEVMQMTSMEGLKSSMKPISEATERTLNNIKDLQESTVNSALHKIGDFQDEAAGVVEGILDFGRAGFRKGLRLTGLQDNIENAKVTLTSSNVQISKQTKRKPPKNTDSQESQEKTGTGDSGDTIWVNPLAVDSPNYDGQIFLEKPKISDSVSKKLSKTEEFQIPSISMDQTGTRSSSPDPEYEDAADLASSIAKLRSLLLQRSSESSVSTPAISPMPDEYIQRITESGNASDLEETDGVMPSFYKFCTKTATGVLHNTLNSIKTALPGNNLEQFSNVEKWKFTSDLKESDILTRMKKLLTERKDYCTIDNDIDTAYEAIDSLDSPPNTISKLQFEDDLDDFEAKIPITKTLMDILCELLADTNSAFIQEPLVQASLLTFGNKIEKLIEHHLDRFLEDISENLINIPENTSINILNIELHEYINALASSLPDIVKIILGQDTTKTALTLLISSLQVEKINEDTFLQIIELIAMKLIEESTQMSPPASA